jgi:hypothetical protein
MSLKEPTHLTWDARLLETDKKLICDLNAAFDRLSRIRAVEINISGKFLRSKIAWKLATYQHVLLHRLVALMDGVAVAWNDGGRFRRGRNGGVDIEIHFASR